MPDRPMTVGRPWRLLACALCTALSTIATPALADSLDSMGKKLGQYDSEARQLASGIRRPSELGLGSKGRDLATRRTIEAQVNFGVGNYEDAAIVLYDVVERFPDHKVYDEALYYLAESLYFKGDFVAARTYFGKLATEVGSRSRFYQQGLERLIELSIKLNDPTKVETWLAMLEAVPAGERRASVPYVLGKYLFHKQQYDEAIAAFRKVPKGTEYYFQARYFIGASHVAKKELGKAIAEYVQLVRTPAETDEARRVVQLAYLAMGRIHYELNQPSKAIDRYLEIPRRSDLFNEAMYEVSWVYVRNKEFEKALRALELLAIADPMSTRLPDVRILEGNLRIRRAQRLGDANALVGSEAEYARAVFVFEQLRQLFERPYEGVKQVLSDGKNPGDYLAQITGRHAETFDIKATLPEVAAAWLREEPEVARIIDVEEDLGQIEGDILIAEQTIDRLEQALATPSRVNIFPSLASKRVRATEILEEVYSMRVKMAAELRKLVGGSLTPTDKAQLDRLTSQRQNIANQLQNLPDANMREGDRISLARGRAIEIDQRAAEVATTIGSAEAQLVAMEKFLTDQGYKEVNAGDLRELKQEIDKNRAEVEAMKAELNSIRRDSLLAQDRAGTGDEVSVRRRELRTQLRQALDAEQQLLQTQSARLSGDARGRANRIAQLGRQASAVTSRLDGANARIDAIVEAALSEVEAILSDEKAKLIAYKHEYATYEEETHGLGGEVLAGAFKAVTDKLHGILMRADVGVVDVAWSMKETADETLSRLNLDQAREMRTLDTDFADVIEEIREEQAAERAKQVEEEAGSRVQEGEGQ